MKPVSVTFGTSTEDDLGIEACFERSMMSELGKGDDHGPSFSEHSRFIDQRDTGSERSEAMSLRDSADSERDAAADADNLQREATLAAYPQERIGEEEEFEMVLDNGIGSPSDENLTSTDEEGEEKVVVWCAEEAAAGSSRSMDSEIEDICPTEESDPIVSTKELHVPSTNVEISFDGRENQHRMMLDQIMAESYDSPVRQPNPNGLNELSASNSAGDLDKKALDLTLYSAEDELMGAGKTEGLSAPLAKIPELADGESSESLVGTSIEWEDERTKGTKQNLANKKVTAKDVPTPMEWDDGSATSLTSLINKRDWQSVMEKVKEFSNFSEESIEEQASLLGRDTLGNSFLHEVCKNDPSAEVIQLWLDLNKDDVERPGIGGHLPLHYACAFGATVEVIDILIDAFPEALMTPDSNDKMLPLHLACREGASTEVLNFLVVAYPEAALVEDKHHMTPFDYAANLKDPALRQKIVRCLHTGLRNNLSAISEDAIKAKSQLYDEQEKVKELERTAKLEKDLRDRKAKDDLALLEYALNRVAVLEKAELEKNETIESLRQQNEEMEAQLTETQQLLAAEKKRIFIEKTRELESALKIEQCKVSALEQSLVAKQEMLEHEKERTRDAEEKYNEIRILFQNERLKTKRLQDNLGVEQEKSHRLHVEQATKIAEEVGKLRNRPEICTVVDAEIEVETAKKAALEQLRSEYSRMMEDNNESIRALEASNSKKQQLLIAQQEKVEALERVGREKESLLQKNQEIMKALEESIERKLALQKTEEDKIRQLDTLRHKKREMIESEEEQVRKLDYTLGRKQALLELELMKEKTLQQTIAQKQALLESERSKVKELESRCAEREMLLNSEQNMVQALSVAKKEKENLLKAERELVNELYRLHSEKEVLLEKKRKTQEEISFVVKELEAKLEAEKDLLQSAARVRADKEACLHEADKKLKDIEERMTKQVALLSKEQSITESLEIFHQRRREISSSGRLYSLVDTTLSISHLVREALLAKQHNESLVEEQKPKRSAVVKRSTLPTPATILKKALILKGKGYISHFAGFLGFSPAKRKYLR